MIDKLKVEIFDLLKEQNILQAKFQELEQKKQKKLQELQQLEKNLRPGKK